MTSEEIKTYCKNKHKATEEFPFNIFRWLSRWWIIKYDRFSLWYSLFKIQQERAEKNNGRVTVFNFVKSWKEQKIRILQRKQSMKNIWNKKSMK